MGTEVPAKPSKHFKCLSGELCAHFGGLETD